MVSFEDPQHYKIDNLLELMHKYLLFSFTTYKSQNNYVVNCFMLCGFRVIWWNRGSAENYVFNEFLSKNVQFAS